MAGVCRSFFGFPYLKNLTEVELAEDVPSNCVCSLCGIVCLEYYSFPCDHRFCVLCFLSLNDEELPVVKCPMDKSVFQRVDVSKKMNFCEDLSKHEAFCFNRSRGCVYRGPLSSVQGHYSFCVFSTVRCETCHKRLVRKDLLHHFKDENDHRLGGDAETSNENLFVQRSEAQDDSRKECTIGDDGPDVERRILNLQKQFEDSSAQLRKENVALLTKFIIVGLVGVLAVFYGNSRGTGQDDVYRALQYVDSRLDSGVFQWDVIFSEPTRSKLLAGEHISSSNMFFSSIRGHAMTLFLKRAPHKSNHLGVYFKLHPGPYDAELKWPFLRNVTFTLVNFKDASLSKSVALTDLHDCECCKDPNNAATGYGPSHFISTADVESSDKGFLYHTSDGAKFRIQFVIHSTQAMFDIT